MRLPTSFVGRLIGPLSLLHMDSKLHIGKFSSVGGVQGVDFRKSYARLDCQILFPDFLGHGKMALYDVVDEENIAERSDAGTGITFIPWCNGPIWGHDIGVLVQFYGFRYHQAGSSKNSQSCQLSL